MVAVDVELQPAPPRYEPPAPPSWQLTREQEAAGWLLGKLIEALARFGVGTRVGLLDAGYFPVHKRGIGILAMCEPGVRAAVAELLTAMGCAWTAENSLGGVEAHLCGKLRPAPPVPPVHVSAAAGQMAAGAAVTGMKRCIGPCGRCCRWRSSPSGTGSWAAGHPTVRSAVGSGRGTTSGQASPDGLTIPARLTSGNVFTPWSSRLVDVLGDRRRSS